MIIEYYVDPRSKTPLSREADGNLYCRDGGVVTCFRNIGGGYDFVSDNVESTEERDHYNVEYGALRPIALSPDDLAREWHAEVFPWRQALLDSLGSLQGKKILVLGNGRSPLEFYFLTKGATVVYSDLSAEAVTTMHRAFDASDLSGAYGSSVEFHAVDATRLPFRDGEFDIVYGSAFAHHLDDVNEMLKETYRCLAQNGICRFIDEADSPIWRWAKNTVLLPLKLLSYRRVPRSPADARAKKGFTMEQLLTMKQEVGFSEMVFLRNWFFLRIVSRHYGLFLRYNENAMRRARRLFLAMKKLDTGLARYRWMQRNQLMLVWGFDK